MKILKGESQFKFMSKRHYAFALSGLIILCGVALFLTRGFNLGIDFTGGTMIEVGFRMPMSTDAVRAAMRRADLDKYELQRVGGENKFFIKTEKVSDLDIREDTMEDHEVVVRKIRLALMGAAEEAAFQAGKIDLNSASESVISRFLADRGISHEDAAEVAALIIELRKDDERGLIGPANDTDLSFASFAEKAGLDLKRRVLEVLNNEAYLGTFTFLSVEIVGPQVGHDLRAKAVLATFWAMLGMLIYIGVRFRLIFGVSAVLTLAHDVLVTLSFILLLRIEMSLTVVAALLTIVGYSLNDTIVVFDRVRDNLKIMKRDNAEALLDRSLNETLSRTIITSATTLLTVMALYTLGGEVIRNFSLTLIIGLICGTYSTIFQSCAWLRIWERRFLKRKKS